MKHNVGIMEMSQYRTLVKRIISRKSLGQNFLISKDIASMEANYAKEMNVIELGPGPGILTNELCNVAKKVISIEKDSRFIEILNDSIKAKNFKLIEGDFFSTQIKPLGKIDIMVSNIPYNLSSKVIYWLCANNIPALICIQKEFAEHMLAKPGTKEYSKLSVMSSLMFKVYNIKEVSRANFYPVPRVDSRIIYLIPKKIDIDKRTTELISLIMNHKKKTLRNAVVDSSSEIGIEKEQARKISLSLHEKDSRPFQLEPEKILEAAMQLKKLLDNN
jgi:16S rRNA (adenine1518-N6/adenine1519-N6)-dimethyltransferase